MKIIYLHQYFSTLRGKEGTRSFEMARRLVKMGHEVHMITSWRDNTDARDWFKTIEEGIVVHWYPNRYQNDFTTISRIIAFLKFALCIFLAVLILGDRPIICTGALSRAIRNVVFPLTEKVIIALAPALFAIE